MKGKTWKYEATKSETKLICLPEQTNHVWIVEEGDILTFKDVDGSNTNVKTLRRRSKSTTLQDEYTSTEAAAGDYHPDLLVNKIYRPLDVCMMFNCEIRKHMSLQPQFTGYLMIGA